MTLNENGGFFSWQKATETLFYFDVSIQQIENWDKCIRLRQQILLKIMRKTETVFQKLSISTPFVLFLLQLTSLRISCLKKH